MTDNTPEVTQADRDAAADLLHGRVITAIEQGLRDGNDDGHSHVQAFARHCAQSTPRLSNDGLVERVQDKIAWLLNEKALAEQQIELQGPSALSQAANRVAEANRRAFDLLPEILSALRAFEQVGEREAGE